MAKSDGGVGWTGKSYGGYWGNKCFALLLRIGMFPAYFLLVFVALYYVVFRRKACAGGALYLGKIFGCRVRAVSFSTYRLVYSFGVSILDRTAYFASRGRIKIDDGCHKTIEELIADGKGVIVLTAHVGGWQIAGAQLAKYGREVGIVGVANEDARVAKVMTEEGAVSTLKVLGEASDTFSMLPAYAALKRGAIIAMHGDRYAGGRFAEVEFLGSAVRAPIAPYILAEKAGVACVQISCARVGLFRYEMRADGVFLPDCSDASNAEARAAQSAEKFFANLSILLKKRPYQWYNFYDFWA